MNGPQQPVGSDEDAVELIPAVQGAMDYFAIVDYHGRTTLCKFDQQGNQWKIMNQNDLQRMLQAAGASSNLMQMLLQG